MNDPERAPRITLRVFDDFQLNLNHVREILGDPEQSSEVVSVRVDGENKSVKIGFLDTADWRAPIEEPPTISPVDFGRHVRLREQWREPAFFFATSWLHTKVPEQFQRLREAEMDAAVFVENYSGQIPHEFLEQIVRHRLELHVL